MMAAKTAQKYLTFLLRNSRFLNAKTAPNLILIPVSGGDINDAYTFKYKSKHYFIKFKRTSQQGFFKAEADGLKTLRHYSTFQVPQVIEVFEDDNHGFLLLSFLQKSGNLHPQQFGIKLAELHQNTSKAFGFEQNNFIGNLPQSNTWQQSWTEFFATQRILPLIEKARNEEKLFKETTQKLETLLDKWDNLIPAEPPALLHGDLWNGNVMQTANGCSIYDPAVYFGHREMDLSMMHLFGGFSEKIFEEYKHAFPVEHGFLERVDLHNLYPLLVHTVLFGGSYCNRVKTIIKMHG